jgi:DNA repair protein RadA/Sms
VAVALEGTAPLLVEVQALVSESSLGTPRRVAHGFEGSRLALLLAVLERQTSVRFADRDVFVNLVGGLSLREPALDLAVASALLSSVSDRALPEGLVVFGEIGLLGEVRAVSRAAERVREAAALGFDRAAVPARSAGADLQLPTVAISSVGDLMELLLSPSFNRHGSKVDG